MDVQDRQDKGREEKLRERGARLEQRGRDNLHR